MQVASMDNDMSWMNNMEVNNEALEFEIDHEKENENNEASLVEEDDDDNDEHMEFEMPLTDDLCSAKIMAASLIENVTPIRDIFTSECVDSCFQVGIQFQTKEILIQ